MKYLMFLLLLIFISIKGFTQFYIGWDEKKIRDHLKTENVGPISKKIDSDGIVTMTWKNYKMQYTEMVFFNKSSGLVSLFSIYPNDNNIFNMLIRIYDENFVKVSSMLWKAYLFGTTYRIETTYSKNLNAYFFYIFEWEE